MKRHLFGLRKPADFIPLAVIAGLLLYFAFRNREAPDLETDGPEQTLLAMVTAIQDQDTGAFLEAFGGELKQQLEDLAAHSGEESIARWLAERRSQIKGFAIVNRQARGPGREEVFTETVYSDRTIRQDFLLENGPAGWKIVATEAEMLGALLR